MIKLTAELLPDTNFARFTRIESTLCGKDFYTGPDAVSMATCTWFRYGGKIDGNLVEFWITKFKSVNTNNGIYKNYTKNSATNATIHLLLPDATKSDKFPSSWWPLIKDTVREYNEWYAKQQAQVKKECRCKFQEISLY